MPRASAVADRALAAMARSELRDPVEGGFFRYATRGDWTVPHYERMLTDNAQLLEVALDAGDADTARGIARFLLDVLQQPAGGFGAAQDSESWIDGARSEGGYYERDAAARCWARAAGGRRQGRDRLERPRDRRARPRGRLAWTNREWIEAARWAADAVIGANAATRRPAGTRIPR